MKCNRMQLILRNTVLLLCGIAAATALSACRDTEQPDSPTDAGGSTASEARTAPDDSKTQPAESGTQKDYADIGDGSFRLEQDAYYVVVGRAIPVSGTYDFDAPAPELSVMADDPDAVEVREGQFFARKAGDFTLTVREETYGTTATATLHAVGDITENIIISVPVWRGKWVNAEQFGYMKDAGVDMVVAVSGVENRTWDVSMHMLDEALGTWSGGRGLFVLAHSTDDMLGNVLQASDRKLTGLVDRFADAPAFAGYHIIDEPYDCNPYASVQRRLGELDPDALTDVNFLPGGVYAGWDDYRLRMDDYCKLLGTESNAYLSFDSYPFGPSRGSVDENALFGNFEAARRAGLENRVRTAFYVQAVGGFGNSYRRPDEATLTYHTASALAYGFKWIKYWSWFVPDYGENPDATYDDYTDAIIGKDGKPTDLYEVAKSLHNRAHTIGSVLVGCEAEEVYHTGSRSRSTTYSRVPDTFFAQPVEDEYAILSLLCHRATGRQYLMIVNKNLEKDADMSFRLEGIDFLTYIDTATGVGSQVELPDHVLELRLAAGDFAFYALPEDGDFRTAVASSANRAQGRDVKITANASQGSDGWFVDCALDGKRTSQDAGARGWRIPAGQTGELVFAFDEPVLLNRIDLYPCGEKESVGSSFPRIVKVYAQTADEPDTWKELYISENVVRPTVSVPVLLFDTVSVLRLRLEVSGGSRACELAEIELYEDDGSIPMPEATSYKEPVQEKGMNYALGKTPIASGSAYENVTDRWGLAYLTDGSKLATENGETNGWMSQGVPNDSPAPGAVWGGVDLGAEYRINEILVYPRQNGMFFPIAYEVQISLDGDTWETVRSVENDPETKGVVRDFRLDRDVTARYVRVVGLRLSGGYQAPLGGWLMQFSEIEVYWN